MSASAPMVEHARTSNPIIADTAITQPRAAPAAIRAASAETRDLLDRVALDLVTTREGFDALEADWTALFERAGRNTQIFQSFNWLWHWANYFLPKTGEAGPQLAIVTARLEGKLVLVWPLVSDRVGPIVRLSWMGDPVSQYGDVLVDDVPGKSDLLKAAWQFTRVRTHAGVLHLRRVRQDSAIAGLLGEIGARTTADLKAPYIDFATFPDFEAYEKRHSSAARRKRRAKRRKLEDIGKVTFIEVRGGAEGKSLTAAAFKFKLAWLRERGLISPAFADARTERFFIDVVGAEDRPANCHIRALLCEGNPVAFEIGLNCKGRSAAHISTYDPEYERFSVGALLWEDAIRSAYSQGVTAFDFLAPGDTYKLEWADEAEPVHDWALATSVAGGAYALLYLGVLRGAVKRGIGLLPVGMRRRIADVFGRPSSQANLTS